MPPTSQLLYIHLGMNADDDGYCEHFSIMRMTESKPDDLRVLASKGFVRVFDDKVLVITDWKENNYIQKDRYTPSKYLELYKEKECIQDVYKMDTQVRLGKGRLGKEKPLPPTAENGVPKEEKPNIPALVVSEFYRLKGWDRLSAPARTFSSHLRAAKQLLEITGGFDGAAKKLQQVKSWAEARDLEWAIETIFKKWEELEKPVLEKAKKPYIDGDRAYEKNGDWYIINSSGEHKKYIGPLSALVYK